MKRPQRSPGTEDGGQPRHQPERWIYVVCGGLMLALIVSLVFALRAGGPSADGGASQPAGQAAEAPPKQVHPSLAEYVAKVQAGQVTSATFDDAKRTVHGAFSDKSRYDVTFPEGYGRDLTSLLLSKGVRVSAKAPGSASWTWLLLAILPILLIIGLMRHAGRNRAGGGTLNPAGFEKGRGEQAQVPETRFSDVAGCDEAIADLKELAEFLRTPERFTSAGAKLPHGYLLVGPPGTGKTLLARAVAGESGVPFFALSGSEFVETYVGVGAARVRTLFAKARSAGKAIVFLDEIDAIGRARNEHASGASDERDSTLNQLLVEMDGFVQAPIVVLAATNRPDILDTALLRPGRFDRQVTVAAPDRRGRTKILELCTRGRKVADGVDLTLLARRTPGFTGADLINLVNQAALTAVRAGTDELESCHFDEALATVMLGPARKSVEVAERDRQITAWHEAGHTLAALLIPEADDPVQVTIVPRGAAGGVTWMAGSDDMFLSTRQAKAKLVVALAGRAAEEIFLGDDFTQGAAHDFKAATQLARKMVTEYGMSKLGAGFIAPEETHLGPMADEVHRATRELLEEALQRARTLLRSHEASLRAVVELLLVEETIDSTQLESIVEEAGVPSLS